MQFKINVKKAYTPNTNTESYIIPKLTAVVYLKSGTEK